MSKRKNRYKQPLAKPHRYANQTNGPVEGQGIQKVRKLKDQKAKKVSDKSVLKMIQETGLSDNYEPEGEAEPTDSLPGTTGKLKALAERARLGLPLWHKDDNLSYGDDDES